MELEEGKSKNAIGLNPLLAEMIRISVGKLPLIPYDLLGIKVLKINFPRRSSFAYRQFILDEGENIYVSLKLMLVLSQHYYYRIRDWSAVEKMNKLSTLSLQKLYIDDFDFYNVDALSTILRQNEFIEQEDEKYEDFLVKCNALQDGHIDYFIGALYYEDSCANMLACDEAIKEVKGVFSINSLGQEPYYAVIFLNEKNELCPKALLQWIHKISKDLFLQDIELELQNIPTLSETKQSCYF